MTYIPGVTNFAPVKCLKEACSSDDFSLLLHSFSITDWSNSFDDLEIEAKLKNPHVKKLN